MGNYEKQLEKYDILINSGKCEREREHIEMEAKKYVEWTCLDHFIFDRIFP